MALQDCHSYKARGCIASVEPASYGQCLVTSLSRLKSLTCELFLVTACEDACFYRQFLMASCRT